MVFVRQGKRKEIRDKDMNEYIKQLPPMLNDDWLVKELTVLPKYKSGLIEKSDRLTALLDIYKIYIPSNTTLDIYNRLYLSVLGSLEKKNTIVETQILNDNYRFIKGLNRYGVIGGFDSFKLTGNAGVGKTSAVERCIDVITQNRIIKTTKPYREIIPILVVETVSDCSIKNLLYSILIKVDEKLNTKFFLSNKSQQTTVDILLAAVSNVLTNHVALLCIDEIERVIENKKGITLLNYLTQLINQSNISICFIGTEESNQFFEMKEYLARRTIGVSLKKMEYGEFFTNFCKVLFSYQYTLNKVEFNSELSHWLYNHSNGLPSMLITLFVEAQREAIISGKEKLDIDTFEKVFKENFSTMAQYIGIKTVRHYMPTKKDFIRLENNTSVNCFNVFQKTSQIANKDINKAIVLLKECVAVEFI